MYCWYLRNTYLENNLKVPGKLTVCGEQLDLSQIKSPVYLYASREDHIVPWQGAYASTRIFSGKKRFMLGASGHIAGVINPPKANKRSHWVNDKLPAQADDWLARRQGSARQLVDRLVSLAGRPCRQAGARTQGAGQPAVQGHRARTGPLRQAEGLSLSTSGPLGSPLAFWPAGGTAPGNGTQSPK